MNHDSIRRRNVHRDGFYSAKIISDTFLDFETSRIGICDRSRYCGRRGGRLVTKIYTYIFHIKVKYIIRIKIKYKKKLKIVCTYLS